jgi:hypothetical protein
MPRLLDTLPEIKNVVDHCTVIFEISVRVYRLVDEIMKHNMVVLWTVSTV